MDKHKRKPKRTLQIVEDEVNYTMSDAACVKPPETSIDFGTPWFLADRDLDLPIVEPHESVSQVSSNTQRKKTEIAILEAKMNHLAEKQAIEQAKFDIRKREEMLDLKLELDIAKANLDSDSQVSSVTSNKPYIRRQTELEHHAEQPSTSSPIKAEPATEIRDSSQEQNNSNSSQKTTEDIIMSVVREMKKPKTEIKKFSGADITLYRKFMRQFDYYTKSVDTLDEKMNLLDYYTTGEANRIITGYGLMESSIGFPSALKELEERYGDEEATAAKYASKALEWDKISNDDPKGLDNFAIFLSECEAAVENFADVKILEHKKNMQTLIKKLPYPLHEKWRTLHESLKDNHEKITFHHFVKFVKREAKKATDPTFGREALSDNKSYKNTKGVKVLSTSVTSPSTSVTSPTTYVKECLFCQQKHNLSECHEILKKSHQEKIDFLKGVKVCYGCLKGGHVIKYCKNKSKCDICSRRHPTILHDHEFHEKHSKTNYALTTACSDSMEAGEGECTMNIIPVKVRVKGGTKIIETYAFRDSGSNSNFCTMDLMRQLGITGNRKIIRLNTMGLPYTLATYVLHNLEVLDLDTQNVISLPKVYTKDKMPVTEDLIPTNADIRRWNHLKNINLPQIDANIGLLIGNRVADAYTPIEVVRGEPGMPHASRTALGWMVWNVVREPSTVNTHTVNNIIVNRCEVNAVHDLDKLETLVHRCINLDFPEKPINEKLENSVEDKRFVQLVESSMRYTENGHYEIGLPFKTDRVQLPNNHSQAEQRLRYLKSKLDRNQQFKTDYTAFMDKIITNGFAVKVDETECNKSDVFYIPHHGVYNPNKANIRVVFDCSSKFHGISLNQMLLSGPDLTCKLISVLLRFRQEEIALIADITSMYYMVKVPDKDTDYLRFLWYPNGDTTKDPCIYKMTVHLFGATSSPSCAVSALQRTSLDFETHSNKEAARTLRRNFYVDDCLRSVPTEKEAIKLTKDLISICHSGGFELSKWMSNSRLVLENIPKEHHSKGLRDLNLDTDDLPMERALGVYWSAETDCFRFKVNLKPKPATRRGILSTICSIYDPLGLASPLILPAKVILQNLCQLKLQWDEEIPDSLLQKWKQWLDHLPNLEQVIVQRCYKPSSFGIVKSSQLHCFSDASECGYGAGIYLRQINEQNQIHCSLVLGKSRVTPLKRITIPRLELTAAVISLRLSQMVVKELDLIFKESDIFYWTDSYSVLRYLNNTTTRFQTFIANRVDTIRESSIPSQWRYVDSKSNVADDFSRGISAKRGVLRMRWLQGPEFLRRPDTEWPVTKLNLKVPENDCEVKKTQFIVAVTDLSVVYDNNSMEKMITYCSSWYQLKKMVAWFITGMTHLQHWIQKRKQINNSLLNEERDQVKRAQLVNDKIEGMKKKSRQNKNDLSILSVECLQKAEDQLLKYTQRKYFAHEIENLQKSSHVKSGSKLVKLDPYLKDGLIRVGGRLQRSNLSIDSKHPIVLPKDCYISQLILQDIHQKVGHFGRNSMLARLREQYWILRANAAVRGIISKCVVCRRYRAKVGIQKMSDLPIERVIGDEPPFAVTGVDFFGPYEIKQGRSIVKRYGVVFTCFKSRAIHIEMAYSLDTDACVNAIRRFTNRRGPVRIMKSDNGSNFIGSNKVLKAEFDKLDKVKLQHLMLNDSIKWEFNPPTASHFGGLWERQIRTIRKLLFALLKEQCIRLSDDLLQTLFSEIENIINSRPITRSSDDPNDLAVLTPNNLLLMNNSGSFPLGTFQKTDIYVKRKWRQIQYLADLFWKRWSIEYLSQLQERQKWLMPQRNFAINDIVLLVDNTVSRSSWCLGRITEVKHDKHGLVRIVTVKSKGTFFERPIDKICLLLEADDC